MVVVMHQNKHMWKKMKGKLNEMKDVTGTAMDILLASGTEDEGEHCTTDSEQSEHPKMSTKTH